MTGDEIIAQVRKDALLRDVLIECSEYMPPAKRDLFAALYWRACGIAWSAGVDAREFVKRRT